MEKQSWIPLPAVTEATEGQIAVGHTGMPVGLDLERIELNVRALRRGVIGLGGYERLSLSAYAGDTDQYTYGANGADASGAGTAAFGVSIQKADAAQFEGQSDADRNARHVRNGMLGIQWNSNALNQRLDLHEQYDPAVRASQLDKVIRQQSIQGIYSHNVRTLFRERRPTSNALVMGIDALFVGSVLMGAVTEDARVAGDIIIQRLLLMKMMLPGFGSFITGNSFKDYVTDPLFWSVRPFRATAAAGVLATRKLVRAAS